MSKPSGWQGFTGAELAAQPAEVRQRIEEMLNRMPIAEVRVKLYNLAEGGSEIQVCISPEGELKDGCGSGQARADAYARLLRILTRELTRALNMMGEAATGEDSV